MADDPGFVRKAVVVEGDRTVWYTGEQVGKVATFVGTATTLLAGLLTFFGVKDGILDRIVRTQSGAVLGVFVLIGLAVLLGALTPVLVDAVRVRPWVVTLPIVASGLWLAWVLPDFPVASGAPPVPGSVGLAALVVGAGLVAVAFALSRHGIPLTVAAIVAGVCFLSLGLYGAFKLAVLSKQGSVVAQVSGSMSGSASERVITLVVQDSRLDHGEHLDLALVPAGATDLAQARARFPLFPDSLGGVDRTITLPAGDLERTGFAVWMVACPPSVECRPEERHLKLVVAPAAASVGGTLAFGADKAVVAALQGTGPLPSEVRLQFQPAAAGAPAGSVATGRVVPTTAGVLSWTATVPGSGAGTWTLSSRTCAQACTDADAWAVLAVLAA